MKNKLLMTTLASAMLSLSTLTMAEQALVAITQIVSHPSLNAIHKGIVDELAEQGYKEGDKVRYLYEIAQGDMAIAGQIAKKFAGESPDVTVPISTPSAQTVAAAVRNKPIVFAAITDPVGAKLVKNLGKSGTNITGITDAIDVERHIAVIKQIAPNAKRIGRIYNPGETNSVSVNEDFKHFFKDKDFTLVEAVATKSSEVLSAARSLVGKVDVIYIAHDNTTVSALEGVLKVCEQNDIPVFAADKDSVARGVLAGLGVDYYDVGRATGKRVAKILQGADPGDMAIGKVEAIKLAINTKAAEKMGVTLSKPVLEMADEIIE